MRKKIIILVTILIFILLGILISVYLIDQNRMNNNEPVLFSTWGKNYSPIEEQVIEKEEPIEEIKPEYVDTNTVDLGIYIDNGYNLQLVTQDYYCDWSPENVMGLFYAVPTKKETLPNTDFDTMWKDYINKYPNAQDCRIGYSLEFTLDDGSQMYYTILNPDDAYYTFPQVMSFLYDDVNLVPGKPYYHITQDVMYDYTICSSLKLVGDVDTYKITSDIKLTAFCFDSEDDFDDNGHYRGNSYYTITIKR